MKPQRMMQLLGLLLWGLVLLMKCTHSTDVAGATTETTNGITGVVQNRDGTASINTIVKLFVNDYNPVKDNTPGDSYIDTTDDNGVYIFNEVASRKYSILARNRDSLTSILIKDIEVIKDSLITIQPAILNKSGAFSLDIKSIYPFDSIKYVYIPGTDIYSVTGSSEVVLLNDIPSDSFPTIVAVFADDKEYNILQNSILIVPNDTFMLSKDTSLVPIDTTDIPGDTGSVPNDTSDTPDDTLTEPDDTVKTFSQRIILNTSPTGAEVNAHVYNFPVLIRLTDTNFDFSQARSDGSDIRFTRSENLILPFEIELWDAFEQKAAIWVKVDTIYGNNSEQSIIMHWGNTEDIPTQRDVSTFDTSDGFKGVWHLGENTETVFDATQNHYDGIKFGNLNVASSVIGHGISFNGGEAYCDMGNVFNPGSSNFTVSAWIKRAGSGLQTILAKSNGGEPFKEYGWSLSIGGANELHCFMANGGTTWGDTGSFHFWSKVEELTDTTRWYFIAAVIDREDTINCKIYIDGAEVTDNTYGNIAGISSLENDVAIRIGAESDGGFQYTGLIDEVVISHTIRSDAWIRLCYINQGANDRLVVFK